MGSNLLTLRILGGVDIGPTDGFDYYAGEEREITFQIMNDDTNCKYALPTDITNLVLTFPGSPDDVEIALGEGEIDDDDRSIISVTLDEDQTDTMISGFMRLEWDDDSAHRVAYADFIQTKITTANA